MDEIDLSEYIDILSSRRKLIAVVALVAFAVTFIVLMVVPRTYRGKAVLLFPQVKHSGGLLTQLSGLPSLADLGLPTTNGPGMYSEILQSRTISERVIKELGLGAVGVEPDGLQEQLDVAITKEGGLEVSGYVPSSWVRSGKLTWLNRRYPNTDEREKTRQLAAEMANAYVKALQDFDRQHALSAGRTNRQFLEKEVEKTKLQLADAEEAQKRFQEAHPTLPPPDIVSQQMQQVIDIRARQIEAETEMGEAEQSIEEARRVVADQDVIESASKVVQENPVVTELKSALAKAQVRKAQFLENLTERHPDVVAIDQEIAKTEDKIRREVAKVTASETLQLNPVRQTLVGNLAALEIKKSGIAARVAALDDIMTRVERELSSMAKDQMSYMRLAREVKALEAVYMTLRTDLSKAMVAEAKEPDGFTVLDWAAPEKQPVKPRVKLTLFAVLVLGAILGSFIAIIQESARPKKPQGNNRVVDPVAAGRDT